MTIEKIISGGQTGADIGGLIAGKILGIPTGGIVPVDGVNENGRSSWFLNHFNVTELVYPSYYEPIDIVDQYRARTLRNVLSSDGTILFGMEKSSGSKLTIKCCHENSKPYIVNPGIFDFIDWAILNNIKVLNVAGNRESKKPGITLQVIKFLVSTLPKI